VTLDLFNPSCRCALITVGARRWCVTRYADGGCGGFWSLRSGRWTLRYSGGLNVNPATG